MIEVGTKYYNHKAIMPGNKQEIQIIESMQSYAPILHLDSFFSIALALALGIISLIGIFIKGLFLYYIKYKAPKDRPINRMIFVDQVSNHQSKLYSFLISNWKYRCLVTM